ncbi:alginate lyase family protein [uncultured Clostridium sp.]|uniref:alginate lyase family protein n=1 Tax=uncultured Clostridium sp. TaxID=59620 RepID=UPI002604F233|nr:alginate lyase family protein [uncultured Clostridium sp.]
MKKFYLIIISLLLLIVSFLSGYFLNSYKENISSKYKLQNFNTFKGEYNKADIFALNNSSNTKIKETITQIESDGNVLLNSNSYPTVTDKTSLIAKGETNHDFAAMTPYLFNDPSSKTGYTVKDGVDNPERLDSSKFDSQRLAKLVSNLNTLSFSYALTGNQSYATKAVQFLKVWFLNPATKMNPNMNFGEFFVTSTGKTYTFNNSNMISAIPFIQVVNDIYLLEDSNSLSSSDLEGLKDWFNSFSAWLTTSSNLSFNTLKIDNHGTWLQSELSLFNAFAGNKENTLKSLTSVGPDVITPQIKDGGKIPSALIRTKSVDYTEYNLEAFITLADIGQQFSIPIWNYTSIYGGNIKSAITYLNNYLLGKDNWPYQNISGKNVHEEDNGSFISYLALAYNFYKDPSFLKTINTYSKDSTGISYLILESRLIN